MITTERGKKKTQTQAELFSAAREIQRPCLEVIRKSLGTLQEFVPCVDECYVLYQLFNVQYHEKSTTLFSVSVEYYNWISVWHLMAHKKNKNIK